MTDRLVEPPTPRLQRIRAARSPQSQAAPKKRALDP